MSKNSSKQNVEQFKDWLNWVIAVSKKKKHK